MTVDALEVVLPLGLVAPDQMRQVVVGELAICVAHTRDGGWFAIDDTCTHEDCSLSEGELSDHSVECPCHGSRFDLRTGDVLNLPAVLPVQTHRVVVVGDQVRVELRSVDTAREGRTGSWTARRGTRPNDLRDRRNLCRRQGQVLRRGLPGGLHHRH